MSALFPALVALSAAISSTPIKQDEQAAAAGFHVVRSDATYPVDVPTKAALMKVFEGLRHEQGWIGLTKLSYEQRVNLVPGAEGCRLEGLRATLGAVVTMPRRSDAEAPRSRAVARAWGPLAETLRAHEEGHVALGIQEARASYERLAAAGPFDDCRAARRALLVESFRLRQRQAFIHDRYDRVTRFGTRQWAWRNEPVERPASGID